MSLTPSTMLDIGTIAPDFSLEDVKGETYDLAQRTISNGLLVIFMCNHCPYVMHIIDKLGEKIRQYQQDGIEVVAINSNDYIQYRDDSPEKMGELARFHNFSFPYLIDEDQEVAKAYRAACTPDFFLFDENKKLVYRGRFDAARPGNSEPITGDELSAAVAQVVAKAAVPENQLPSMGCNIKWREGNAPEYFG